MPRKVLHIESIPYFVNIFPDDPITTCEIYEGHELISWGLSYKRPNDTYNRKEGCRRAIASAIRRCPVFIEKSERRYIWDEFLNIFPIPQKEIEYEYPENIKQLFQSLAKAVDGFKSSMYDLGKSFFAPKQDL